MYTIFHLSFLNALGGSPMELAVVIIAVLILFGSKSLPQTLRTLGRWSEQLRQISRDIQREINDAGEPFQQARKEWEETNRPYRVERSSIRPPPVEVDADEEDPEISEASVNSKPPETTNDSEKTPHD
ncbi:MAG: twin-arginine translocase TatA/TatE family subunit [Kiritimatiellae bacterium]|jgi:Sec-independent protein translocase protein TatA|nr:twin-arginine translocase TatA/TatE family subunit [Kiritimatiellia bacterium]